MDFKDLKMKLDGTLKEVLNKETFSEIGKTVSAQVKTRTRLGKGVDENNASQKNLKPLQDGTKLRRKAKKQLGKLSSETTPAKSNLTDTGEMLNSLKYETSATEVRIYIDGENNQKKARDQVKQGRKFMKLSKAEVNTVISIISKKIKDTFK